MEKCENDENVNATLVSIFYHEGDLLNQNSFNNIDIDQKRSSANAYSFICKSSDTLENRLMFTTNLNIIEHNKRAFRWLSIEDASRTNCESFHNKFRDAPSNDVIYSLTFQLHLAAHSALSFFPDFPRFFVNELNFSENGNHDSFHLFLSLFFELVRSTEEEKSNENKYQIDFISSRQIGVENGLLNAICHFRSTLLV